MSTKKKKTWFFAMLAVLLLELNLSAEPLRVFVSYTDAASFAPNTVVDLFLTGTDEGGYVVERKTGPGPFSEFIIISPAIGFGRQYWRADSPSQVVTIYPGDGYIFPVTFIDNATSPIYRAKKQ